MSTFVEQISIAAPQHLVWKVLADIGSIHKWNPGVVDSHRTTVGEVGNGAGRRCELGGKNYLDERVVEWEPEKALTMRIVETNLPFQVADIRFTLEEKASRLLLPWPRNTGSSLALWERCWTWCLFVRSIEKVW